MMPLNARVQRFLPFGLPALLALITIAVIYQGGDDKEPQVAVGLQKEIGADNATGSSGIENAYVQGAFDPVPVQIQTEAPANLEVVQMLERYRKSDQLVSEKEIRALAARPIGKQVKVQGAGMEWSGTVDSRLELDESIHIGITLDNGLGRFQVSLRQDDMVKASLMFTGESHAFSFSGLPKDGNWKMEATSVDHILCTPLGSTYPVAREQMAMPKVESPGGPGKAPNGPVGAPPILNSNPSSPFVIYCDFDGEVVTHPLWNDGNTINAAPHPRADDAVFVTRVWDRVSEDYAPFNINVTTDRAVYDSSAESRRVMCVITPTDLAAPGAGGVAYLGSFGFGIPCWAFNDTEAACADTISHEIGHTVGLRHDGVTGGFAYYGGHGAGPTSWAPIMGAYFADFEPPFIEEEMTQFSKGEYPQADNQEDDFGIITGSNGFSYRQDDKGNSFGTASPLNVSRGVVTDAGIIEKKSDKDWFAFATSGGRVTFNVNVTSINSTDDPQRGSNLAVSAEILDANGKRVLFANPQNEIDASISTTLKKGNYYLVIDGAGRGDLATGFSDYGSLGRYSISGSVPQNGILTINPATLEMPRQGGEGSFEVTTSSSWTWTSAQDWVKTKEAVNQKGNQVFEYTVDRNLSRAPRTASIRITDGAFTSIHAITQQGSEGDDHGDQPEDATLVTQVSTTDGKLEVEEDIDVFRVDVQGFGKLSVRTTGSTDTFGELLDANGVRLASNDDRNKPNFAITRSVGTGTYYISVRHAHEGGFGAYKLVCSFEEGDVLIIDPAKRLVGTEGGNFIVEVSSNADWSWSSSAKWLKSDLPKTQSAGQIFAYEVAPNNSANPREAELVFTSGSLRVVHTVTQKASGSDDHGGTLKTASKLLPNGTGAGNIEYEGDEDLFRVTVQTSGQLRVVCSGSMDSYGQLLNSKGNLLVSQDGGNGDNFMIFHPVVAGTYFVRVRHFSPNALGKYQLTSSFTPSALVDVKYSAAPGGYIVGPLKQKIRMAGDAQTVTAVPLPGYSFHSWSDGLRKASRTDRGVFTHMMLTAKFVETLSVRKPNGELVKDNQNPPVDFGTVAVGDPQRILFTVTNNGTRKLENIRIVRSGSQADAWLYSGMSSKSLSPGKSATFAVTLKSNRKGYKEAFFSIAASGRVKPFQLRVMGFVGQSFASPALAKLSHGGTATGSQPVALAAAKSADGKSGSSSSALDSYWLGISDDGLIHYRLLRKKNDESEPGLWITTNGADWDDAFLLDYRRVYRGKKFDEYEALIVPPSVSSPIFLVSESPPASTKP